MWKDEIVEEVRAARRAHAEKHGRDLRQIVADLRRKQESSGRNIVTLPPRPPRNIKRVSGLPGSR
jgi:hypothetical protein